MADVIIRPLRESELGEAGRIVRLAFGSFMGTLGPEPLTDEDAAADTAMVRTRWRANPAGAFAAVLNGKLVGSVIAASWGSVGYFGPLTVLPDAWDQGIGKRLLEPVMETFTAWGVTHAGLFTFAHSPKHLHLYQHFGFWPRFLTAILSRPVGAGAALDGWTRVSALPAGDLEPCLETCRGLTSAIYPGLDLRQEIAAVHAQRLGDTVLQWDSDQLAGLAICHYGAGSEAANGRCYVKFGAVRPGPHAASAFERLIGACETLAQTEGLATLEVGVNMGRHEAYRALLADGFRTEFQGIAMHQPNEPGYNLPGVYLLDDWR